MEAFGRHGMPVAVIFFKKSFCRIGPAVVSPSVNQIIASSERARAVLGWRPQRDDLATIVGHALAWERKLMTRNR